MAVQLVREHDTDRERTLEITFRKPGAEAFARVQVGAGAGVGGVVDYLPASLATVCFRLLRALKANGPNQESAPEAVMGTTKQDSATNADEKPTMDMNLEVVVIPVTDIDRALRFYQGLRWRLDADYEAGPGFRIVQLTPPGSGCSIQFGRGVTPVAAGSAQGMYLVVHDLDQTRAQLIKEGVDVSEVFHRVYDTGAQEQVNGPDPNGLSYHSFATFSDPDGNGWLLQEVQVRQPGR